MENMKQTELREFTPYEYKELNVKENLASFYLDCYENFGWQQDDNFPPQENGGYIALKLKRNRKIINKVELTRLQRNFEADLQDIFSLEHSKTYPSMPYFQKIAQPARNSAA